MGKEQPNIIRDPLLSTKQTFEYLGIGRSTLWSDVKNGRLPKPYYVNAHRPRWKLSELNAAVAAARPVAA